MLSQPYDVTSCVLSPGDHGGSAVVRTSQTDGTTVQRLQGSWQEVRQADYLSVCLSVPVCLCTCLSLSVTVCLSLYLSVSVPICFSVPVSLSVTASLSVSFSLYLSVSLPVSLSVTVSFSLYLCLCTRLSLSLTLCTCLSLSLNFLPALPRQWIGCHRDVVTWCHG